MNARRQGRSTWHPCLAVHVWVPFDELILPTTPNDFVRPLAKRLFQRVAFLGGFVRPGLARP